MRASTLSTILFVGFSSLSTLASRVEADRGPHHSAQISIVPDTTGILRTNRFVQVEAGLNYEGENGEWIPTVEEIGLAPGGATAWKGPHKVSFAANLNVQGAVQIQLPDGKELVSHIHGLALTDIKSGHSVLIAPTKNSEAWIYPPNEIVYHDAFEGLRADVRYRYTKLGIEQDIILRERPEVDLESVFPGRSLGDLQFEVWTEFTGSPAPDRQQGGKIIEEGVDKRNGTHKSLTLEGEDTLGFGSMEMAQGKTYPVADADETLSLVTKHWIAVEGRSFLVEAVPVVRVDEALDQLPSKSGGAMRGKSLPRNEAILAVKRKSKANIATQADIRRASREQEVAFVNTPGVVVDYQLVNSVANFTFRGDTTYYVTNAVTLTGTNTIFEGGTVIKFGNTATAGLIVESPISWGGSMYQPVNLVAVDDHSVGETIGSGSVGTNRYANPALDFRSSAGSVQIAHLRISNAKRALLLSTNANHVISHAQIRDSTEGVFVAGADFKIRNMLFANVLTNLAGTSSTGRLEHVTTCNTATFSTANFGGTSLYLTNCLLVAVTTTNPFTWTGSSRITGTSGVFQAVGGGAHYLSPASSLRNAGVSGIHSGLRDQLKVMTTYPPTTLIGIVTVPTTLFPRAVRDSDSLDIGYHYPPLDYLVSTLEVTNTVVTLADGVAMGFSGLSAIWLQGKSTLVSRGRADRLNYIVRSTVAQEAGVAGAQSPASNDVAIHTYNPTGSITNCPDVSLRFTSVIGNTPGLLHLYHGSGFRVRKAEFWHSQVVGGAIHVDSSDASVALVLGNNLWDGTDLWIQGEMFLTMHNQLTRNASVDLWASNPANSWVVSDSVFENSPVSLFGEDVDNFNNAYIATASRLTPTTGTNLVLTGFTYTNSTLGRFYQGQTNLVDRGSRTAGSAGLYHFTAQLSQSKETNSVVDVGFHYLATDADGKALDADGDGVPDYLEDYNGSGETDASESEWSVTTIGSARLKLLTPTL